MKEKKDFRGGRKASMMIGTIFIALLLTAGAGLVQLQTNQVIENQMVENHCILCDQLSFSEEDGTWEFSGTEEEFEAAYGEEGGRALMQEAIAGCPAGAGIIQQIIDEYEGTGSLEQFFAPLYSYVIPGSDISGVSQSLEEMTSSKYTASFDAMSYVDIRDLDKTISDRIIDESRKIHYTYEDIGFTYEEIYNRAVAYQGWLEGGSYPEGMGDPAMNNAELVCLQIGMVGAGLVKCAVVPFILLAPLFFGGALAMRIAMILNNFPEVIDLVGPMWDTCVAVVGAIRAGFGLPP